MKTRIVVPALVAGLTLAIAAPASATTFCVPSFHAACPNDGTNVAQANLETAMQSNSVDGIADTIVIDAGTRTDTNSFEAAGTDDLEIIGAGAGTTAAATRLTSSSAVGVGVVRLFNRTGTVAMRDLTVVLPTNVAANSIGVEADADTLQNVDIESQGHQHLRGATFGSGGTYSSGAIYGVGGGGFLSHAVGSGVGAGSLELSGLTISNANAAVEANSPTIPVTVRRSRIAAPGNGVAVGQGGSATVENVVITDPGNAGIAVTANTSATTTAAVRHTTIARVTGPAGALPVAVDVATDPGTGGASASVRSSIIRGFTDSYRRFAPVSPMIGDANLLFTYSNFVPIGSTDMGDGAATLGDGNINADPLFAGASDFHLLAGSPSIDAADPASPVTQDIDGAPRPADGDGDSVARSDMGAFEVQPPPSPSPPTSTAPATGPTGERAAALRRCKKKAKKRNWSRKQLKKCRRKARLLPE